MTMTQRKERCKVMRKIVCLIAALLMCVALASPAFAAADQFVPSISYKDGPELEDAVIEDEDVGGCVIVTSIPDAREKTTDIYQEDRDLLIEVYEKLSDGSMKLPYENDKYVIRELVDVSFKKTSCVEADHGHKEELARDDTTITIRFDLGVHKTTEVIVMAYIDGEWAAVESVTNNGDGTVTCVFEDICPVVFCVEEYAEVMSPKTGDAVGRKLPFALALMAAALSGLTVLQVRRRKQTR